MAFLTQPLLYVAIILLGLVYPATSAIKHTSLYPEENVEAEVNLFRGIEESPPAGPRLKKAFPGGNKSLPYERNADIRNPKIRTIA
jgi:hypothetical protein